MHSENLYPNEKNVWRDNQRAGSWAYPAVCGNEELQMYQGGGMMLWVSVAIFFSIICFGGLSKSWCARGNMLLLWTWPVNKCSLGTLGMFPNVSQHTRSRSVVMRLIRAVELVDIRQNIEASTPVRKGVDLLWGRGLVGHQPSTRRSMFAKSWVKFAS